jgi:hypothetical protein
MTMKKAHGIFWLIFFFGLFVGEAIGQDLSPEAAWQNQVMRRMYELAPSSGSACGKLPGMAGEDTFACGMFDLSAATTKKILKAGWQLKKVVVYLPPGVKGLRKAPRAFRDLRVANPGTLTEVLTCTAEDNCKRIQWVVVFVPPAAS